MDKGDTFTLSFIVENATIDEFAAYSGDNNPMHMDAEFAKQKGFKDRIAHGNILGAKLSFLVGEKLPLKNVVIQKQEMGFARPVFTGDELTLTAEVIDYYESVKTYELRFKFENQEGQKVCSGKLMIGIL